MKFIEDEKDAATFDRELIEKEKGGQAKKFMSRAELEDHWRFDCEAFYFFCPTCGK